MKFLCNVVLTALSVLALAAAVLAADGVTATTANVGGATAQVTYVTMTDGRAVVPAIANHSIHTDAAASAVIGSVKSGTVVAAVNGGFFNSYYNAGAALSVSTGNYPHVFSTIVSEGMPICAGGQIAAIGMDYNGNVYLDKVSLIPTVTLRGQTVVSGWGVNSVYNQDSAVYFLTDVMDYPVSIPATAKVVTIRNKQVVSVTSGGAAVTVADGTVLMVYGKDAWANAVKWEVQPVVGNTAVLHYTATPSDSADKDAWNDMRTVIAGGGMLVQNGKNVVDSNTSVTAADQQPDVVGQRTFVAQMNDGRLMLGTVSSSFRAIANSLIALGAKNAIFMDGGASSMLYANGKMLTTPGRKLATVLAIVDESAAPVRPDLAVTQPGGGTTGSNAVESDIPSAWAEASVEAAREKGILPDHLDGKFQRNITRKEFCDLIAKFFRVKTGYSIEYYCKINGIAVDTGRFSDSKDYYVPYVAALGIIDGYPDGTFRPKNEIQRQDAAIMLQRLATRLEANPTGAAMEFTDGASNSGYAKTGVDYVTSAGIMKGNADGSFSPRKNITREQAIITIMNADEVL